MVIPGKHLAKPALKPIFQARDFVPFPQITFQIEIRHGVGFDGMAVKQGSNDGLYDTHDLTGNALLKKVRISGY